MCLLVRLLFSLGMSSKRLRGEPVVTENTTDNI
jgi:hypothetical protein